MRRMKYCFLLLTFFIRSCDFYEKDRNSYHVGPVDFSAIRFSDEYQEIVNNADTSTRSKVIDIIDGVEKLNEFDLKDSYVKDIPLINLIDAKKTESYVAQTDIVSATLYNRTPALNSVYDCQYIGQWNGVNVAYRRYKTGGSGVFSEIFLYKGRFTVTKVIFSGDRATNGILPNPVLSDDGKIYFYANLTTDKIVEIIEKNKEQITYRGGSLYGLAQFKKLKNESAISYWNTCKLVYDIKKDNLDIRAIKFSISKIAEVDKYMPETPIICMNEFELKTELYNWLIQVKK